MRTTPHVGVLAVQGGVAEHAAALTAAGAHVTLIRSAHHLSGSHGPRIDALILPGGESTTQDKLLRMLDLAAPITELIRGGLPTLGTCAGLILLADRLEGAAPQQRTLGGLDITVSRNAWGSQLASHEVPITVHAEGFNTVRGAFIRAPQIDAVGPNARVIARHDGRIVGATSAHTADEATSQSHRLGTVTGISFHPEVSGDLSFHTALVEHARRAPSQH